MKKTTDMVKQQPRQGFNLWIVYVICLIVSLLFMFFYGLNSPIYNFNSCIDYQWYLTMGRGLVAGKMPYRDLFEQKGPIVYLVFAFASLFPNPQYAVWCIEIVCISLFLFFCYKISRKFLSPWSSLLVLPLMMMVLSTNYIEGLNGSRVEEYCLPIFAYGLLCFLDFIMDHKPATWRRSLALGICIGILFWVKYTMLEFFIFPLLIWLVMNLVKRNFKTVLFSGSIMFGGFLIVTIPIIIWFAIAGALGDLFEVYFVINITCYDGGNGKNIHNLFMDFVIFFCIGIYYILVLLCGLVCFVICNWRNKGGWLFLINILLTFCLAISSAAFIYYYLPLFVYSILGVIYLIKLIWFLLKTFVNLFQNYLVKSLCLAIVTGVSFLLALPFVTNLAEVNRSRDNYAPLVVADIITDYNQTASQTATVFCYRMLDVGVYNASKMVPIMRFYAQSNFTRSNFPEMFEAFDNTIREQTCDFVITYRDVYDYNETFLTTYYHPYFDNNLDKSTLHFYQYDPFGYYNNIEIVILFRN